MNHRPLAKFWYNGFPSRTFQNSVLMDFVSTPPRTFRILASLPTDILSPLGDHMAFNHVMYRVPWPRLILNVQNSFSRTSSHVAWVSIFSHGGEGGEEDFVQKLFFLSHGSLFVGGRKRSYSKR